MPRLEFWDLGFTIAEPHTAPIQSMTQLQSCMQTTAHKSQMTQLVVTAQPEGCDLWLQTDAEVACTEVARKSCAYPTCMLVT